MPLNEALTNLANAVRNVTANEHKLSIADMSKQLTNFNFIRPNLLEHTKSWYGGTDYWGPNFAEIVQYDKDKNWIISKHSSNKSTEIGQECTFTCVDTINPQTANISCHLYIINAANKSVKIKNERLYVGTLPGVWTPNPADKVGG